MNGNLLMFALEFFLKGLESKTWTI